MKYDTHELFMLRSGNRETRTRNTKKQRISMHVGHSMILCSVCFNENMTHEYV